MLTSLREKSQSLVIFVLFGILIVVFIFFFGPQSQGWRRGGGQGNDPNAKLGEVGGEPILRRDVEISVRRQAMYGSSISEEQVQALRQMTAEQVKEQVAAEQGAKRMGMAVGENEITRYVVSKDNADYPFFADKDDRFDYDRYQSQVTRGFAASSDLYRQVKARELLVNQYLGFLESQIKVSDAELRQDFDNQARSWNLEFVEVEPQSDQAVTDAEAQAFAKTASEKIAAYYESHKKEYVHGEEVKIRRILVKPPKIETTAGNEKARNRAEELLAKARTAGQDFAALAEAESEDFYKSQGGDMGWISAESASAEDFAIYSKLEKGQISDLQKNAIGYWFVLAEDKKPAINRSLEDVTDEIARKLAAEDLAMKATKTRADALLAAAKNANTLAEAIAASEPAPEAAPEDGAATPAASSLSVQLTGPFGLDRPTFERIPLIGESAALARALPNLTAQNPLFDQVIEVDGHYVVARLVERHEPEDAAFETEKENIRQKLQAERARNFFGVNWQLTLFGAAQQRAMVKQFGNGALDSLLKSRIGSSK